MRFGARRSTTLGGLLGRCVRSSSLGATLIVPSAPVASIGRHSLVGCATNCTRMDIWFLFHAVQTYHVTVTSEACVPRMISENALALSSRQLLQERLRLLEIGRIKAFGEPAVDRRQEVAGFGALALVAPEAGEAGRGAQLE
jgi:hypothetical protein